MPILLNRFLTTIAVVIALSALLWEGTCAEPLSAHAMLQGNWKVVRVVGEGADAVLTHYVYELNSTAGGHLAGWCRSDDDDSEPIPVHIEPESARAGTFLRGAAGSDPADGDSLSPLFEYSLRNYTEGCLVSSGPYRGDRAGDRYQIVMCGPTSLVLTVIPAAADKPLETYHWQKIIPQAPPTFLQRIGGPWVLMIVMIVVSQFLKGRAAGAQREREQPAQQRPPATQPQTTQPRQASQPQPQPQSSTNSKSE